MKQNISQGDKVVAFVTKQGNVNKDQICTALGINKTYVHELMNKLRKNGQLNYDMGTKMYSLPVEKVSKSVKSTVKSPETVVEAPETVVEAPETVVEAPEAVVEAPETVVEAPVVEAPVVEATETSKPRNHGRDFSKFVFNGQELRKGKYLLAVFTAMLASTKMTKSQLDKHEVFSKLFTSPEEARKINLAGKQRYFNRKDEQITLSCGNTISVTNQIGSKNFNPIMAAIEQTGFKIA
jgi:hypothetical protein